MNEEQAQEQAQEQKKKALGMVLTAMTVGVKMKDGQFMAEPKSGGVAPGIFAATPGDVELNRWLGAVRSEGETADNAKREALRDWERDSGFKQGTYDNLNIEPELYRPFYVEATNGTIWPIIHSMPEKRSEESRFETLKEVDEIYTQALLQQIKEDIADPEKPEIQNLDDIMLWSHDYHVFHVPGMIKDAVEAEGLEGELNVSFFHHEPWPDIQPGAMPDADKTGQRKGVDAEGTVYPDFSEKEQAQFTEILQNLVKADTLGFHTEQDAENFVKTVKNFGVMTNEQELTQLRGRSYVNPIGVPKPDVQQKFNQTAPFLKAGLNGAALNAELNSRESKNEVVSTINLGAIKFRDQLTKQLESFRALQEQIIRTPRRERTPDQIKLLENAEGIINRVANGGATPYDIQTVAEQAYFDPQKTHFGSIQRFDYTKGIQELLQAYQQILREQKANGVEKPGDQMQFNLVTGAGRSGDPVAEYVKYEHDAKALIHDINHEFPGAVYHYKSGIPNPNLPIFNAMLDVGIASSIKDGYILAIAEVVEAQKLTFQEGGLNMEGKDPGFVVSTGAGIARDLEAIAERPELQERMSLVEPTVEGLKEGLNAQITRVQESKKAGQTEANKPETVLRELEAISDLIPDSMGTFGPIAFEAANARDKTAAESAKQLADEHREFRLNPLANAQQAKQAETPSAAAPTIGDLAMLAVAPAVPASSTSRARASASAKKSPKKSTGAKL
jgi:trehalose-6-phosphate synthase